MDDLSSQNITQQYYLNNQSHTYILIWLSTIIYIVVKQQIWTGLFRHEIHQIECSLNKTWWRLWIKLSKLILQPLVEEWVHFIRGISICSYSKYRIANILMKTRYSFPMLLTDEERFSNSLFYFIRLWNVEAKTNITNTFDIAYLSLNKLANWKGEILDLSNWRVGLYLIKTTRLKPNQMIWNFPLVFL